MTRDSSPDSRGSGSVRRGPASPARAHSERHESPSDPRRSTPRPVTKVAANPLLAAGFEALDLLKIGVVVCDASAKVLTTNATADRILRDSDGLELRSDGTLAASLEASNSLRESIATVAGSKGLNSGAAHRAFAVRRPSGKRPLTLFLRPAGGTGESKSQTHAAVLVLIQDSALPVETTESELRQLYGLTTAEARLSNLLMEGAAIEECCEQLGIRRTTARMHLRNIFAKTGVRRQSELVALLLRSIGLGPRLK